jgi:hypothetical protein
VIDDTGDEEHDPQPLPATPISVSRIFSSGRKYGFVMKRERCARPAE